MPHHLAAIAIAALLQWQVGNTDPITTWNDNLIPIADPVDVPDGNWDYIARQLIARRNAIVDRSTFGHAVANLASARNATCDFSGCAVYTRYACRYIDGYATTAESSAQFFAQVLSRNGAQAVKVINTKSEPDNRMWNVYIGQLIAASSTVVCGDSDQLYFKFSSVLISVR